MRTKEEFEKEVRKIINKKLVKVYYSMIDFKDDKYYWNQYDEDFHCLDYGLIIQLDDKKYYKIIWDSEYFQFGLNLI